MFNMFYTGPYHSFETPKSIQNWTSVMIWALHHDKTLIWNLRERRRFKHKRSNKSKMVFHVNGKVVVGKNETWNPKFLN